MVNQKSFEDFEPKAPVEKTVPEPVIEYEDDCRHREKTKCVKHNKTIAIDSRQAQDNCWDRMGCDDYEKRVKT